MLIVLGLAIGGGAGALSPGHSDDLDAAASSLASFLVGLAAVLVAAAALYTPSFFGIGAIGSIHHEARIEMAIGVAIGALTFTGSIIAFLKLRRTDVRQADPAAGTGISSMPCCWR